MTRTVLAALLLVVSVSCWSNYQLLHAIDKACPAKNFMCPKNEYGLFHGFDWKWDSAAILSSPAASRFLNSRYLTRDTLVALKDDFCCMEGSCLYRCGIFPRTEIDLIHGMTPLSAQDILDLDIPEMEKHRDFMNKWINKIDLPVFSDTPAELEEFFDDVHLYQDKIREKLRERQQRETR